MPLLFINFRNGALDNDVGTASATFNSFEIGDTPTAALTLQTSHDGGATWTDVATTTVNLPNILGLNQQASWTYTPLPNDTYEFRVVSQGQNSSGEPVGNPLTSPSTPANFVCFMAGTLVATPSGQAAVETLAIGDMVLAADGRAVPVMWLGRQTVSTMFGMTETRHPVLIRAGALGNNLPVRDLGVTADHAMLIDGVLVQAGALVNGSSIIRMPLADLGDRFTVFHIETEHHEIIVAEGAATETFIDNVTRRRFDNFAEFAALYGAEGRPMDELPQPRAMSLRQVPAVIRARIAAHAVLLAGDRAAAA
ncbi:Hint domain-containing protein [Humitalea sp. 24SJ18S-53]|uniref:Hint domain-containing protein n=1 Tax=Humitalea sp. 24SJ18S-53 TaxID=3422307 RepID=UPI003D66736F